ncbi:MAG TPA: DUF3853 family protein [Prolixibacteraceae bacterium]|nr:DUF3853 family protein [Prolixibacteraceae bacterium]
MIEVNFNEKRLEEIVRKAVFDAMTLMVPKEPISPERRPIKSMRGIADFLGCSVVTAQKLKNSGKLPCHQFGRKVLFFTDEVLKDIKPFNQKKG